MKNEKTFLGEIKAVAGEFSRKEWAFVILGVVTFVLLASL